jgi:hypothetical protein
MPRKVILGFRMIFDGYIACRKGALAFLVSYKEGESVMTDFFASIDTTIMGRKTAAVLEKMRKSVARANLDVIIPVRQRR